MIRVKNKFTVKTISFVMMIVFFALYGCSQSKQKVSNLKQSRVSDVGAQQSNGLKSLTLQEDEGQLAIKFQAERALSPNIFRLSDPQRIVVDLVNTRNLLKDRIVIASKNNVIQEVTVNEFNDSNNILSRVVIVLNAAVEYEAHALNNGLALKISRSDQQKTIEQDNDNLSIAEFSLMENEEQNNSQASAARSMADKASNFDSMQSSNTTKNQLIKILSRPKLDGTEIELIFSGSVKQYEDFSLKGPNRIVFDLQQVENVLAEGKTVSVLSDEVSKIRLGEAKNKTRAVIDLSRDTNPKYEVSKQENRLKIYIPAKNTLDAVPVVNKTVDIAAKERIKVNLARKEEKKSVEPEVSMAPVDVKTNNIEQQNTALEQNKSQPSAQKQNSFLDTAALNKATPSAARSPKNSLSVNPVDKTKPKSTLLNELNDVKLEKSKQETVVKLMLDKNSLNYDVLNPEPGVLNIQLDNTVYKKSKLKKILKRQNYSGTAIKKINLKKVSKQSAVLEVSLQDQAIFEVGEENKGLLLRVRPKKQIISDIVDSNSAIKNTKQTPLKQNKTLAIANTQPATQKQEVSTNSKPMDFEDKTIDIAESEVETLANDLVEIEGLEDNVKNTFPQERVIKNPLGVEVQDSSKIKNYAYVKEEFMSDTIADGEPLSQMGSILSGAVEGKKFTGRRISLDFKDAEVKSIFKLIAEISQFNIIISDDVVGRITIRLDEVPWDQAFAIILQTRGLWFEKYGNIIRVAPAAKLQQEKEAAANAEKAAKAVKPLDILFKPVSFAQAGTLEKQVKSVLSDRGTVDIDSRTNTLIIKDIREHLDKAKRMIDILDTQTPQVTIEARIVEATTTFTRSFGINWSGSASFTSATGNPTGLFFPNSIGIPNFALNFPVEAGAINTQANLRLGSINNILDLDLAIALGEQEGNFKLISSPKVTVLDNSSATISAGTQIPYQTQSDNLGTNVNFQTANTSLTVTPHITNDGSILMNISATRDEPNFSASVEGNPTIDQRTASTEVLVKSGNTTVIGGIYSTSSGGNQSRLPVLHRIPIIGALFKNYNKTVRRSELLIFVTPRIVGDERKAIRNVRE
ncbi:type IV pilus secretin PilQ [bacterium]|nr:type IV pilus secretin PilQ [bacterium]